MLMIEKDGRLWWCYFLLRKIGADEGDNDTNNKEDKISFAGRG